MRGMVRPGLFFVVGLSLGLGYSLFSQSPLPTEIEVWPPHKDERPVPPEYLRVFRTTHNGEEHDFGTATHEEGASNRPWRIVLISSKGRTSLIAVAKEPHKP